MGRVLAVPLVLCVTLALAIFLVYGLALVAYPQQLDYGEGVVLQLTQTLSDGAPLYRDPASYPWLVDPYAPLYPAVCAALRPSMGLSLAAGRLVSWLAALATLMCVVFAAASHARGFPRPSPGNAALAGICAAALFICSPLTVGWAPTYRVDFLALFFDVAALLAVDAALRRLAASRDEAAVWPWLTSAALLFALAFFTKQTFVLGLVAATLALAVRHRRAAVFLAVCSSFCIVVPFVLIDRASGGFLFASLFTNNVMPWSWARGWLWLSQYAVASALPVLAVGTWLILERRLPLLWWIYLGLTSVTLLGVGRMGAYFNHFLPFHAALSIVGALAITRLLAVRTRSVAIAVAVLTVIHVVGSGFFCALKPTLYSLSDLATQIPRAADGRLRASIDEARAEQQAGIALLNRYPGDVVAENMALPLLAGRPPVLCDPSTLFAMAASNHWDPGPFVEAVRSRRFGVILLQRLGSDNARFSAEALQAIAENYEEAARIGSDHLLVPRGTKAPP